jgi:DNA-binding transcriptional ArsR family regulator
MKRRGAGFEEHILALPTTRSASSRFSNSSQKRNAAVTLSSVDAFAAIADPARREVVSALSRGDLSAGEVAALFAVSRPAVSRHLRVLREAGLVRDELRGRRRIYRLDLVGLAPVTAWLTTLTSASRQSQKETA